MQIRQATREDAPAVASFIHMAEGEMIEFFTGETDSDAAERVIVDRYIRSPVVNRYSPECCLVAELDDTVAGMILAYPADDQPRLDLPIVDDLRTRGIVLDRLVLEGEPGTFYLSTMGVDPAFRGRGVGTALMTAAAGKGKQAGFTRASLLVSTDKPRVQALYERLGFEAGVEVAIAEFRYIRMLKNI